MGFIEDKGQVIDQVSLFQVLSDLPKNKTISSLESVTSKNKNLIPYLIDILTVTCKQSVKTNKSKNRCEATRILTEILVAYFPRLIQITKEGTIRAIKAGLVCSTDFTMPNTNVKITTNIKNIDFNGLTKMEPTNGLSKTMFGKSPQDDFNLYLNNLTKNGGGGTWKGLVDLHYNKSTEEIQIGLNPSITTNTTGGSGVKFDKFLTDYTNSIQFIDRENFVAKLTDKMTGAVMSQIPNNLQSLENLVNLEKLDALQNKIQSSDPCKDDYKYGDDYYTFTNDELSEIDRVANEKYLGVRYLDLGCGTVPATVDGDVMSSVFDNLRNSDSSTIKNNIQNSLTILNNQMTRNVDEQDKYGASISLNSKMIESIPKILTDVILEPKMVVLYQLCSKVVNGPLTPAPSGIGQPTTINSVTKPNINTDNGFDYAKASKTFFEYVTREALAALLQVIFEQVKKEIISLVTSQVQKLIKEKIKIRSKAISSVVTGVVDGLLSTAISQGTQALTDELKQ
jgi:hypothetical protein